MVVFYRRMPKFGYVKPSSLQEALDLIKNDDGSRYKVYAGGTDLMPKLKKRLIDIPETVVNLKGISDLNYIRYSDEAGLAIGAAASIYDVATSPQVREKYTPLAQGAWSIASVHIQNRATIVGNICSAVPSADSAPPLLALGAQVKCASHSGVRTIPIEKLFTGPSRNCLLPGEIVEEISVPPVTPGTKGIYLKLSHRERMDLAVVGVAVVGVMDDSRVREVRIGLGAVAPTPVRASLAEEQLTGAVLDSRSIETAARTAAGESKPIDDHRASAEYRRMMVEVLVRRGLQNLLAQ